MTKIHLFLLLLLILPITTAKSDINIEITSSFEFSSIVNEVNAKLYVFPIQDNFTSVKIKTDGILKDDYYLYQFYNINKGNMNLNSDVTITDKLVKLYPTKYPINSSLMQLYLQPTEIINSDNPDVIGVAKQISDSDDYYIKVYEIAEWVRNNIQYNLTTITYDTTQIASWVLENREGVCDEITALFIAMLRANNIPARYVSGFTYSNSTFSNHGWSEVYFPEVGWVPYDVTFGMYGYMDDKHVKLKTSADANKPSVVYQWKATKDINIVTDKMDIQGEYNRISNDFNLTNYYNMDFSFFREKIRDNSYNRLDVKLSNPNDFYVPVDIYITTPLEVSLNNRRIVSYLKPGETKTLSYIFHIPKLERGYIYSFPFMLNDIKKNLTVHENSPALTLEYLESITKTSTEHEIFFCYPKKEIYYIYETPEIRCNIFNVENYTLCYNNCKNYRKPQIIDITPESDDISISLKYNNQTLNEKLHVTKHDIPVMIIQNIEYPKTVEYGKPYLLKFSVNEVKEKTYNPSIVIDINNNKNIYSMENNDYVVTMDSTNLKKGNNTVKIQVIYYDFNNRRYTTEESIIIERTGGIINFNKFTKWLSDNIILAIVMMALLVFLIIIELVRLPANRKYKKLDKEQEELMRDLDENIRSR